MTTRLKNVNTGAVVEVADEKVARLGSEWVEENENKPKAKPKAKN